MEIPACGGSIDRDLNAATNLAREGHRIRNQHPHPRWPPDPREGLRRLVGGQVPVEPQHHREPTPVVGNVAEGRRSRNRNTSRHPLRVGPGPEAREGPCTRRIRVHAMSETAPLWPHSGGAAVLCGHRCTDREPTRRTVPRMDSATRLARTSAVAALTAVALASLVWRRGTPLPGTD